MGMAAVLHMFPCGKWQAKLPYVPRGEGKGWHRQGTVVGTSEQGAQVVLVFLLPPGFPPLRNFALKNMTPVMSLGRRTE